MENFLGDTNGSQLFHGLRYHARIVKPDDVETFHDQVSVKSGKAQLR